MVADAVSTGQGVVVYGAGLGPEVALDGGWKVEEAGEEQGYRGCGGGHCNDFEGKGLDCAYGVVRGSVTVVDIGGAWY